MAGAAVTGPAAAADAAAAVAAAAVARIVPAGPARAEIRVVNSRFIASIDHAGSAAAAREFIARIRAEFPDATHNVPAFVIGGAKSRLEFCSDDGEPSGTSGKPLLAVLRGSGLTDAVVVVTRYFGGTLLGSGGLVKAYSEAGKAALSVCGRAELRLVARLAADLPYHYLDPLRRLAAEAGAAILDETFAETVSLVLEIPAAARASFEARLSEMSAGAIVPRLLDEREGRVPIA